MKKRYTIIFWITTSIIFITQGIMEFLILFSKNPSTGIVDLGYPEYFFYMLVMFKILGACALIIPVISNRLKEWAYAGFAFDFIAAFVSVAVVYGFGVGLVTPVVALVILAASYVSYHKLLQLRR